MCLKCTLASCLLGYTSMTLIIKIVTHLSPQKGFPAHSHPSSPTLRQPLFCYLSLWMGSLFLKFSIKGIIQYIYCWLLLFSTLIFIFIHAVAHIRNSFCWIVEQHSIVWILCILLICSSLNGHLCCFQCLAITDTAAINICG